MRYDLLIRGGRIVDPSQKMDRTAYLAFADGKVTKIAPEIAACEAAEVFDARGCVVTPGLIDLHTHCFPGASAYSLDADAHAPTNGTTTWLDAGTSGAATLMRSAATSSRR